MNTTTTTEVKIPIPASDRIIITKQIPESTTPGGIIIPASAIRDEHIGVVVAIGPLIGQKMRDANVPEEAFSKFLPKPGDKVFCGEYAGVPIPGYENYLTIKEGDILAILPE